MTDNTRQKEVELIKLERASYTFNEKAGVFIFHSISLIFTAFGFTALISIFFTNITLIDATCLFVIGYVLDPKDSEINRLAIKGMLEDIANIRLNTAVISKNFQ